MPGVGINQDQDVDMTIPQPIFEFIKAPCLGVWSQASIAKFIRDRNQYETKINERCAVTGEVKKNVTVSIKSSIEPRVFEHVVHYILKKDAFSITDADLVTEMKRKAGCIVNGHVPDIQQLFTRELHMDLKEADIEARIAKYYMAFGRIVEEHGLLPMLGRGTATDAAGKQRQKMSCKLLLQNVAPEMLRVDLGRLVDLTHRAAKYDDVVLHDLIIERATHQQRFHLIQAEAKQGPEKAAKEASPGAKRAGKDRPKPNTVSVGTGGGRSSPAPPKTGCLICQGPHWAKNCPTATVEQKNDIERQLRERRDKKGGRVKRVTGDGDFSYRTVLINGVLEVPFCPDTGSDINIIGQPIVDELRSVASDITVATIDPPIPVQVAGGSFVNCTAKVNLNLRIDTVAGPLELSNIECLVMDAHEEEILLGRATLASIGIDLDRIFEQLAQSGRYDVEADADDLPSDQVDMLGVSHPNEVLDQLELLVATALEDGFDADQGDALRQLVLAYHDVFRMRVGGDEPARVEPLKVRFRADAEPYRSSVRRYPEAQRVFLREYVRELEQAGLIR